MDASASNVASLQAIDDLLSYAGLRREPRQRRDGQRSTRARPERTQAPATQQQAPLRAAAPEVLRAEGLANVGIAHGFSTRAGGMSTAYSLRELPGPDRPGELNVGFTAEDVREHVQGNRARFLQKIYGAVPPMVTLKQIHSALVYRVDRAQADKSTTLAGDGMITDEPGLLLGVTTADCVPVLVADPKRGAVGAFHAGWRGTVRRIVERGVGRMRMEFGSAPEDLVASIGPAIRSCCYRVGDEVEAEFGSQFLYAEKLFSEAVEGDPVREKYPMLFLSARAPGHSGLGPALHLDLQEANRLQLLDAGLRAEAVDVSGQCTSCRTDLFFSYRAEHGVTGRMLAVIQAPPRA